MSADIQTMPEATEPWPSRALAWYAVFVLMIVLMFDIIDRQIITLLVGPIKRDLKISDTQMGLLMGFAFSMFNLIVGLPLARLADVKSRRLIIGVGVALWSAMTVACGFAQHYWHLFVARIGVGVGEACNGPATFSMLSDYFPKNKLAKAAALLTIGFYAGSGLALIVGGQVVQLVAEMPEIAAPLLGSMKPWQIAFIVVGLPGLLISALMATVQEPKRRGFLAQEKPVSVPVREVFGFLLSNWRLYGPMYAGMALRVLAALGAGAWLPTFFQRTYGWAAPQVGFAVGVTLLTISPLGLLAGGFLAEWLSAKGYHDANMRVYLISSIAVLPASVVYPLMPWPWLALGLFAVNSFAAALGAGPANAALQTVTPNPMRAQLSAVYVLIFNLVGAGLGPLVVGGLTDYLFQAESQLRYSMALCALVAGSVACLIVWHGLKPYRQSVMP